MYREFCNVVERQRILEKFTQKPFLPSSKIPIRIFVKCNCGITFCYVPPALNTAHMNFVYNTKKLMVKNKKATKNIH